MQRREFTKTAMLTTRGVVAKALFAAPAVAEQRRELTMVTAWPKNTPGVGANAGRFAENEKLLSPLSPAGA